MYCSALFLLFVTVSGRELVRDERQCACPGATVVNPAEASRSYSSMNPSCGESRLDSRDAWCAEVSGKVEWMQIDLGSMMCVNGVVTQGRKSKDQRVTSYKVSYSADGKDFTELPQVYTGNDRFGDTKVTNNFNPVQARYVRFIVQTYDGWISMRAAVIASAAESATTATVVACNSSFVDSGGDSCQDYAIFDFCTANGSFGGNWTDGETFDNFTSGGETALVCPQCGCGECYGDNDACLQDSTYWGPKYTCKKSKMYCKSWGKDMRRCCPVTCRTGAFDEALCKSFDGLGGCTYPNAAQCLDTTEATTDPTTSTTQGCFDEMTFVWSKNETQSDNHMKQILVKNLKEGDLVKTRYLKMQRNEPRDITWTRVTDVTHSKGGNWESHSFLFENGNDITVTSPHIMIIWKNEEPYLIRGDQVRVGDVMIVDEKPTEVTNIKTNTINVKVSVETEDGTIEANGVLASGMCDHNPDTSHSVAKAKERIESYTVSHFGQVYNTMCMDTKAWHTAYLTNNGFSA